MSKSKSIIVLIDGKETSILESKFEYFKEMLGAELITGQPESKEEKKAKEEESKKEVEEKEKSSDNKEPKEEESLLDKVNPFKNKDKNKK